MLPQNYATNPSYGALSSRLGGGNGAYPPQHASGAVYPGTHPNIGLKTPSPSPTSLNGAPANGLLEDTAEHPGYSNPEQNSQQYTPAHDSYSGNMNQHPQYLDSQAPHMPGGQSYTSQAPGGGSMPQYASYQPQPSVMHPGSNSYAPSPGGYGQYGGYNGVTSPHSSHQGSSSMGSQMLPLPTMPSSGHAQHHYGGGPGGAAQGYPPQQLQDTTGQVAPPGMKPRVTATLWEDEGSMCFQVEAKGVCVARRDDNHMINGTKLLNVAGMTRGRRDGILKSEKTRHVVKIGPMHLKGVWIPFDRALDFANREKITESLYPLFVHNIGALLYHPTNHNRTTAVMAAHEKQKLDKTRGGQVSMVGAHGSQAPSLHHHHSMASSQVSQSPHQIAPHPGTGRPSLDRAHTFPTPPTSASSGIGMSNQSNDYAWGPQNMAGSTQGSQAMIEPHAHSTPNTPATTPPGHAMSNLQSYQTQQPYDAAKSMYSSSASQQGPYAPSNMPRYASTQSGTYMKHEMGPPTSRITEMDEHETKPEPYPHGQTNPPVGHSNGEEEADHEHDTEYSHDNNHAYSANRSAYSYNNGTGLATLQGEHPHLSPEMTGSPSHPNGSGRVTPRNSASGQAQWPAGHQTPPRGVYPSNAYNPISDARGSMPNGTSGVDTYGTSSIQAAYAPAHMNGTTPSTKRMREDEDQEYGSRPASRGDDIEGLKRRKMGAESVSGSSYDRDNRSMNRTQNRPVQRVRR
ncbi:MAG: hypothetical protein LQ339_005611 [Xanthoria mediterranea]|nr:MAG: hypothetical protein LQ339_005611 [Xanthoria mediterranea]